MKSISHLASRLDTFPDTKITNDPGQQETQSQLPPNAAQLVDTSCDVQNSSSAMTVNIGCNVRSLVQKNILQFFVFKFFIFFYSLPKLSHW